MGRGFRSSLTLTGSFVAGTVAENEARPLDGGGGRREGNGRGEGEGEGGGEDATRSCSDEAMIFGDDGVAVKN